MRAPPVPPCIVDRRGAWQWLVAALAGAAGASVAAWAASRLALADGAPVAAAAVAALVMAMVSLRTLRPAPVELGFDGEQWRVDGAAGRLAVVADLGPWMLLRFDAEVRPQRARWLPLARTRMPQLWHGLRCAVCAGEGGARAAGPKARGPR